MDQIRNYVDAMFSGFSDTKTVREMKRSITENMQERFEELRKEGKNENEALGAVISQFGSMDEIKKEFGLDEKRLNRQEYSPEESLFAVAVPPVMLYQIYEDKDVAGFLIFVLALAIYLVLGLTLNLWHPTWIVFQAACAVIELHRWSKGSKERKFAH